MLFANVTDRTLRVYDLQKLNSSSMGMEGGVKDLSAELVLILRHLADSFTDSSKGHPVFKTKDEVKKYFLELVDLAVGKEPFDFISAAINNADASKEKKFAVCKSIIPFLPSPLDSLVPIMLTNEDNEFDVDETVRFFDEVIVPVCKETKDFRKCFDLFNKEG